MHGEVINNNYVIYIEEEMLTFCFICLFCKRIDRKILAQFFENSMNHVIPSVLSVTIILKVLNRHFFLHFLNFC